MMTSMSSFIPPKWAREIKRFIAVKPQFLLWGNIYDVYPKEEDKIIITYPLTGYLKRLLIEEGYSAVLLYEPINGLKLLEGKPEIIQELTGTTFNEEKNFQCTVSEAAGIIEKLINNKQISIVIILNFASRLAAIAPNEIEEFYYTMFRLCQNATPRMQQGAPYPKFNAVFWMLDKENDIPAWYMIDNSKLKVIPLPKPDNNVRQVIIETLSKDISGFLDLDEIKRHEGISIFIDQTNGLHANEIISIVSLVKRENVSFNEIAEAIRRYKIGIVENPWAQLDPKKIELADEILGKRVKGQSSAIKKAADIIKRSIFNLSGSQYSKYSNRPKGVLFFAGPTGVGKTELAKAITELIFGSETSYIRFDMTEFKEEHADQRLIGSPPGYIGYDVGGQLTNAVRQNPYSVILFDEIEKAHHRVLDIFMQILDDGRLTSGRGETVYFSESLIIFTSNLGLFEISPSGERIQHITEDMEYQEIEKEIKNAIEDYFKYKLGRPEILNRIGENIVVFDFIRPDIADQIFTKMFQLVLDKLTDTQEITIEVTSQVRTKIKEIACADLSMGGRGIGNHLEQVFINPLSRSLFKEGVNKGDIILVNDIQNVGNNWELTLLKRTKNK